MNFTIIGRLDRGGRPTLRAEVLPCDLELELIKAEGRPVPAPVVVKAILDTASLGSSVSEQVLDQLGLCPTGMRPRGQNPGSDRGYGVSLRLLSGDGTSLVLRRAAVFAHARTSRDAPVMLGTDLLKSMRIIIDGPGAVFTLSRYGQPATKLRPR